MPLLNYTTRVDAAKTTTEIQMLLAKAGASAVLQEYDAKGRIHALSFRMRLAEQEVSFRLPCDPAPVLRVLHEQKVEGRYKTEDQAIRVAWRIVKDWVEAQLAIIETQMVTTAQVFLPYAITRDGQTVYEYIGGNTQLLLGGGDAS